MINMANTYNFVVKRELRLIGIIQKLIQGEELDALDAQFLNAQKRRLDKYVQSRDESIEN